MGGSVCTPGDPYWLNVQILEDGEAAATKNWAPTTMTTTLHGTPAPSATTPLAQNDSTLYNGTTDWTEIGVQADWEQGGTYSLSGTWTIDVKLRCASFASGVNQHIVGNRANLAKDFFGPTGGFDLLLTTGGQLFFILYSGSSGVDFVATAAGAVVLNTNYDIRCVLAANTIYMSVNGAAPLNATLINNYHPGNLSMGIGARHTQGQPVDLFFNGRIECRITNGIDRGHVAYTPEASWIAG